MGDAVIIGVLIIAIFIILANAFKSVGEYEAGVVTGCGDLSGRENRDLLL